MATSASSNASMRGPPLPDHCTGTWVAPILWIGTPAQRRYTMRFFLALTVAGFLAVLLPGRSLAQDYVPTSPNAARAYHHFLTSPYSFRTFSSGSAPYTLEGYTPYGYERYVVGPSYIHQRITPYGF